MHIKQIHGATYEPIRKSTKHKGRFDKLSLKSEY